MQNIQYQPYQKMSAWRKLSMASWRPTGDSSTYCLEEIIMDNALDYCKTNRININSLIIKILSNTLEKEPKINASIRFWRIRQRKNISVFFHLSNNIQDNLSGLLIEDGHEKSLEKIDSEYQKKINDYKNGYTAHDESKKIISILPAFLSRKILSLYSFCVYNLNLNIPIFKSPKNAFGSVMLTSIGQLGISKGLCPIAPYTRVPMVISIGKIEQRPVVVDDQLVIRKTCNFGFTFDHRIMDGIHFSNFLKCFKDQLSNPKKSHHEEKKK